MRKNKILIVTMVTLLMLVLSVSSAAATEPPPPPKCECKVGSPGYWMNHPEAWDALGYTNEIMGLSRDEAIALMKPDKGDKWITLFRVYVAARLNYFADCSIDCPVPGTDTTIGVIMYNAGGLLTDNPRPWKAKDGVWQNGGEFKYYWLDKYVNGELCVPARD